MPLSTLRPVIGAAAVLFVLTLILPLSGQTEQRPSYERDERLRGLVKPLRQVTLGSPADGIVGRLLVQEHAVVERGQVLIQMDDAVQQVSVAAAKLRAEDETEIRRQRLLLAEAEIQLERMENLQDSQAAQEWEVRRSRLQRDATEAALDAAIHQREMAQKSLALETERLERMRIRAPFDGQIMRITSESGAALRLGEPILQMMAMDVLEAQLYLPVTFYGSLEIGRDYTFLAEEPVNREITGRLKSIEPVIDSASQTFRVLFTIDNEDLGLPVGFTVRLLWPQPSVATSAE